ncbi:bromodomain-containing protein 8 [Phlebotomus argentipes]|uniref:bromodomain-containing protein 8 n=1 Tax=Phlebotomus argentipes TaxID=94469 RepID=UPI00289367C1|nr:bromodomain-containing protein 8 [Phlebotomus argentipes]
MASIQERLQMKRIPLDKWSVREQLFLAAAVACSGENWMSVSRSLKMYCGANRPSDWFSQKSCAAQYGKLLENVEMPKRKKRTASERDTPTSVDTPGESIYRKLTQERIQELKKQIQDDQKEFGRLKEEILFLHSASVDENRIREMWAKIELEKKQKEREQIQHQQWLKEREERKLEMEKAWRPGQIFVTSSPSSSPRGSPLQPMIPLTSLKIKQEEMDVEDSAAKQGTSPLLTSLLKSPSPAPNPTQPLLTTSSPTSSRTAPTITNLLTGQSQIITSAHNTPEITSTIQFLPGIMEAISGPQTTPSQAAPTLSMLLDNKGAIKTESTASLPRAQPQIQLPTVETKPEPMDIVEESCPAVQQIPASAQEVVKDEDQQLMDDFNGLIPDNIDELADILTDNNAIILSPELLEEESILENVDSLIGSSEVKPKVKDEVSEVIPSTDQDVIVLSPEAKASAEEIKPDEGSAMPQAEVQQIKTHETENSSSNESKDTEKGSQEANAAESETIEIKSEPESSSDCDDNSRAPQEVDSVDLATTLDDSKSADGMKSGTDCENRSDETKKDSDSSNSGGTEIKSAEEPIKIEISTDDEDSNMKLSELAEKQSEKEILTIDLEDGKAEGEAKDSDKMDLEETSEETNRDNQEEAAKMDECERAEIERKVSVEEDVFEDAKETMDDAEEESIQQESGHNQSTNVDTDDDYPIEVIKEDKVGRTKRDYSRKKPETLSVDSKKSEDSNEDSKSNLSLRMRLKDRERSESPLVTDDDGGDVIPRTRRRYSSTHAADSVPSSPASSEDREYKAWKKAIMPAYNRLSTHKYASIFLRSVPEDQQARYRTVILRPMDLHTLKRNLETGAVRSTAEFQRDVLLMCQNAMMFHKRDSSVFAMAKEMMAESVSIIEAAMETWKAGASAQPATKVRSRKSQRHPVSAN